MDDFDQYYRGYVIREKGWPGYFVGPDSDAYRVTLREHAERFTKHEAIQYIKCGLFCKEGEFVIEDAR